MNNIIEFCREGFELKFLWDKNRLCLRLQMSKGERSLVKLIPERIINVNTDYKIIDEKLLYLKKFIERG